MPTEIQFDVAGWQAFLGEWDARAKELLPRMPASSDPAVQPFYARGSILQDGATDNAIGIGARNLGRELPDSLERFFKASNGLVLPMLDAEHARMFAVEQLCYLRDNEPWLIADREADKFDMPDEEYRRYGREQNPLRIPSRYYRGLVQLCPTIDSAVLAMNPEVVTASGEWEAWHLGFEVPGTIRYPTFEAMMIELREQTLRKLEKVVRLYY